VTEGTKLGGKKLGVSVLFDTVSIEVICGDEYEAQVLFDDLAERLGAGQDITIKVKNGEDLADHHVGGADLGR
jgi:hypothetical protein